MTVRLRNGISVAAFIGIAVIFLTYARPISAIPSFSRRYQTSCTTCHVLPPKLNAFGVAFKNNGYRIPGGDEDLVKQPDVSLGSPAWKQVWPKGVWPGAIADRVPLSAHVMLVTDIAPHEPVKVNFVFPEDFELMAAGTLGETFSYFGELEFEFEGPETGVGLPRAFLGMNNLLNTHLLNFTIGRFEPRAAPFTRITRQMTDASFVVNDLQAVPGGFRSQDSQQGIEMWGAKSGPGGGGFEYGLGVVNGSGPFPDDNSHKDFYASASYKFGGMGVLGPTKALTALPSTEGYIDNSFHVGVFSYVGRTGADPLMEIRHNRVGVKFDGWINRLNVFGAYVHGRDRVLADPALQSVNSNASFVEANVMALPWVMGILRYEQALGPRDFLHVKRVVPGVALMLRANIILSGEAQFFPGKENRMFNGEEVQSGGAVRLQFLF